MQVKDMRKEVPSREENTMSGRRPSKFYYETSTSARSLVNMRMCDWDAYRLVETIPR